MPTAIENMIDYLTGYGLISKEIPIEIAICRAKEYAKRDGITVSCVMLCWVSVLERLPDESDYYIVFSTAGIHIEWFRKEDGKFGARNGSEVLATYWMAKPPKPNRA